MEGTGASMVANETRDPWVSKEALLKNASLYLGGRTAIGTPWPRHCMRDFSGFPPLLIHVGADEALLDDSTRAADKARAAGVEVDLKVWDDMIHVFHCFRARAG